MTRYAGWIAAADGPDAWWLHLVQVDPPLPGVTYPVESDSPHVVRPSVARSTFRGRLARVGAPVVVKIDGDQIAGRLDFKRRPR